MHYAIVTETYPPEVNGVALTVRSLEDGLRVRGHRVSVVRPRQPGDAAPSTDELLVQGLPLPRYPGLRLGLPCAGTLAAHWRSSRPDAIYVATEGPLGWSALRAARRLGIPAATGLHTRFDQYMCNYGAPLLAGPALAWMRRFHNRAQATLVPTQELALQLQGHGFRKLRVLPRAVDTRRFDPILRDRQLRAEWNADDTGLVVLHVGRIASEKNLPLAVRAFRRLQQTRPDARFVWVGDGPERAGLERAHPDFVFRGVRHGEDLARHYASGDLFLFPSLSETFGNVTLEAMASGIPPVAFGYGAAGEHLQDGVHGAAVTPGDEDAFIDAACRIGGDRAARTAMARAGREAVARLRPAQVAADFDALLAGLLEKRGKDGPIALV